MKLIRYSHRLILNRTMSTIADMRKPYKGEGDHFDVKDLVSREPYANFTKWFDIACKTEGIMEANAMALGTATKDGKPSVRMVLMKGYDKRGFVFFTNYESRKGNDLEENPAASVCFYWTNSNDPSETDVGTWSRQIRIEGTVEKVSESESVEYFNSRPRSSQIGACVSNQSRAISGREVLIKRKEELETEYADESKPVKKPDYWGGFRLVPNTFEFWQGQTNRLHDRLVFYKEDDPQISKSEVIQRGEDGWVLQRLSP